MLQIDKRSGFHRAHVVKAILLLEKPMGRKKLMKELNLNEASTRTLIKTLEKNKIIKPSTKGCLLTKKGKKMLKLLKRNIRGPYEVEKSDITISKYNIAYIVRNKSGKINKGIEQRDEAIKIGADGLTTLIYDKTLRVPGVGRSVKWLSKKLDIKERDVVLIGSAKDKHTADLAALYNAYLLLDDYLEF